MGEFLGLVNLQRTKDLWGPQGQEVVGLCSAYLVRSFCSGYYQGFESESGDGGYSYSC